MATNTCIVKLNQEICLNVLHTCDSDYKWVQKISNLSKWFCSQKFTNTKISHFTVAIQESFDINVFNFCKQMNRKELKAQEFSMMQPCKQECYLWN